ncbi:hypothetical protein AN403_3060 [Pseudomonas fluorescens]|uniref:Uncharacterized protein n=1 Tax=Pseudomonas fluorescens TaxID=294 RepID=A0A0N8NX75_PSEFL|nr:hypothetical protein AN403_3060 [Pseudomonas fluorescens]
MIYTVTLYLTNPVHPGSDQLPLTHISPLHPRLSVG